MTVSRLFQGAAMKSILRSVLLVSAVAILGAGVGGCNRSGTGNDETPKTTGVPAPSAGQAPGSASATSQ